MLIIFLLITVFSSFAFSSENFSDHESYCEDHKERACLALLTQQAASVPQYSKDWYKLVSYKLDYFYDKREFRKIETMVLPLLEVKNKPTVFEMQLNYYYSKALAFFGEREKAKHYAHLAIAKLEKIYHVFEDPMRMVELANMEYVFGDKEKAYQLLLLAENKFGERGDPIFQLELNTNKGHVFFTWQNYERAAKFYKIALDWIKDTSHDAKTVIAFSNFARINQLMEKHDTALEYFKKTELLLLKQDNPKLLAIILLRTAEVYKEKNDLSRVLEYLNRVNYPHLSEGYYPIYHRLANKVRKKV